MSNNFNDYIVSEYHAGKSIMEILEALTLYPEFAGRDPSDVVDDVIIPALAHIENLRM